MNLHHDQLSNVLRDRRVKTWILRGWIAALFLVGAALLLFRAQVWIILVWLGALLLSIASAFRKRLKDWVLSFRAAALLLLGAIIFYGLSLNYQAGRPNREAQSVGVTRGFVGDCAGNIELKVAFPIFLSSDGFESTPRPMSINMMRVTGTPAACPSRTPTPSPTFAATNPPALTSTPIVTDTPALGSSSTSVQPPTQGTDTQTPTTTLTPSATPTPKPYVVVFSQMTPGVQFVDKSSALIPPQVALTPGVNLEVPAVLYVQRAPLATPVTMTVIYPIVYSPAETPLPTLVPDPQTPTPDMLLRISIEDEASAQTRRLWDLVLGPTTPLLALVGALGAFVAQLWQQLIRRRTEEETKKRSAKESALVEIAQLMGRAVQSPYDAARRYEALRKEWAQDRDIIERLDKVLQEIKDTRAHSFFVVARRQWGDRSKDEIRSEKPRR